MRPPPREINRGKTANQPPGAVNDPVQRGEAETCNDQRCARHTARNRSYKTHVEDIQIQRVYTSRRLNSAEATVWTKIGKRRQNAGWRWGKLSYFSFCA